tara:strand:- start:399 stop:614 length:216 start_codon:yes stop_codon:yes gene_type:complete
MNADEIMNLINELTNELAIVSRLVRRARGRARNNLLEIQNNLVNQIDEWWTTWEEEVGDNDGDAQAEEERN